MPSRKVIQQQWWIPAHLPLSWEILKHLLFYLLEISRRGELHYSMITVNILFFTCLSPLLYSSVPLLMDHLLLFFFFLDHLLNKQLNNWILFFYVGAFLLPEVETDTENRRGMPCHGPHIWRKLKQMSKYWRGTPCMLAINLSDTYIDS